MPWNPTRPLSRLLPGPSHEVLALLPLALPPPPLLPASLSPPLLLGRDPHRSRCMGLCSTGEPCTLTPGLTARRLKLMGSRSSSRRRLLLIRRVISAALGRGVPLSEGCAADAAVVVAGEEEPFMDTSSLRPEDEARGAKRVGGGSGSAGGAAAALRESVPKGAGLGVLESALLEEGREAGGRVVEHVDVGDLVRWILVGQVWR